MGLSEQAYRAAAELARRSNDGVEMFRPLPHQERVFTSKVTELLVRGGNRSGKSTTAAVLFAAAARDKKITLRDGRRLYARLPWQRRRPLLMWVVGEQWQHIGDTIWRMLFKPGLYKIIRDDETGLWRPFLPECDADREKDAKPSFPLIPLSEVKGGLNGIGWKSRKHRWFDMIELTNGTIIRAFASTGEVKQGDPVDWIWIDEEIQIVAHYAEWQARLSDQKGRIVWSSLSRSNPALLSLTRRAQEQSMEVYKGQRKRADVSEIVLTFSDNPYIDEDEKRKRLEGWDEENRRMRDRGEYVIGNMKVYPNFSRSYHCAIMDDEERDDELSRILRQRNGNPPENWTRWLILDPGTAKPGVLFCAIPPPELWRNGEPYYIVYGELYEPRLIASEVARKSAARSHGQVFHEFVIDGQAARQTPMGFNRTIGQEYTRAFEKHGLSSVETGCSFVPGDPNFATRSQQVESAMAYRACGTPQLRIVVAKCTDLVHQLESNLKKVERGPNGETIVLDKPAKGQKDDLRNCLEYWLSRRPTYVEPPRADVNLGGPGMKAYEFIRGLFSHDDDRQKVVHVGPGHAA